MRNYIWQRIVIKVWNISTRALHQKQLNFQYFQWVSTYSLVNDYRIYTSIYGNRCIRFSPKRHGHLGLQDYFRQNPVWNISTPWRVSQ